VNGRGEWEREGISSSIAGFFSPIWGVGGTGPIPLGVISFYKNPDKMDPHWKK